MTFRKTQLSSLQHSTVLPWASTFWCITVSCRINLAIRCDFNLEYATNWVGIRIFPDPMRLLADTKIWLRLTNQKLNVTCSHASHNFVKILWLQYVFPACNLALRIQKNKIGTFAKRSTRVFQTWAIRQLSFHWRRPHVFNYLGFILSQQFKIRWTTNTSSQACSQ